MNTSLNHIKVTPWLVDEQVPHCCLRRVEGGDPNSLADRVAFIEKTPRVRIAPLTPAGSFIGDHNADKNNWQGGPKGAGGPDGDIPANQLYGFYPPSREWCDKRLVELGYTLG